mgnify:CR=1 FL=1
MANHHGGQVEQCELTRCVSVEQRREGQYQRLLPWAYAKIHNDGNVYVVPAAGHGLAAENLGVSLPLTVEEAMRDRPFPAAIDAPARTSGSGRYVQDADRPGDVAIHYLSGI